ncbi:hypothetical protein ASPSYDRAFT_50327 [Aspergillus sydowii CBS 593.65]|uniref:Uncharacterized protein n=1 Tax=Aspergillus sydowii CBS 593.65 TaxID=1036612 RepID=A0A1L9T4A9_9EURO|nr:uncharacterized protein ASPSYDRAFT_50327 [Aspergillus sydowii CBS 593.65]OJJ54276.1 hypothetical protein ASPSYDRAFT_50327 [Aspergillus sydowii CBS 593.65]
MACEVRGVMILRVETPIAPVSDHDSFGKSFLRGNALCFGIAESPSPLEAPSPVADLYPDSPNLGLTWKRSWYSVFSSVGIRRKCLDDAMPWVPPVLIHVISDACSIPTFIPRGANEIQCQNEPILFVSSVTTGYILWTDSPISFYGGVDSKTDELTHRRQQYRNPDLLNSSIDHHMVPTGWEF